MTYAAATSVSESKSRDEIERILIRYGATGFQYGWDGPHRAIVQFKVPLAPKVKPPRGDPKLLPPPIELAVKFELPFLPQADKRFWKGAGWREVGATQAMKRYEQDRRSRWRGLVLGIKAKLEMVEAGITTFEEEFFAHLIDPQTGQTMSKKQLPELIEAYAGKNAPLYLPPAGGT